MAIEDAIVTSAPAIVASPIFLMLFIAFPAFYLYSRATEVTRFTFRTRSSGRFRTLVMRCLTYLYRVS